MWVENECLPDALNGSGPMGWPGKNGPSPCAWNGGPPYPNSNFPSCPKYGKPASSKPPGERFIGKPRIFRAPPKNGPRPMLVNCFIRRSFDRLFWNQTYDAEQKRECCNYYFNKMVLKFKNSETTPKIFNRQLSMGSDSRILSQR